MEHDSGWSTPVITSCSAVCLSSKLLQHRDTRKVCASPDASTPEAFGLACESMSRSVRSNPCSLQPELAHSQLNYSAFFFIMDMTGLLQRM